MFYGEKISSKNSSRQNILKIVFEKNLKKVQHVRALWNFNQEEDNLCAWVGHLIWAGTATNRRLEDTMQFLILEK